MLNERFTNIIPLGTRVDNHGQLHNFKVMRNVDNNIVLMHEIMSYDPINKVSHNIIHLHGFKNYDQLHEHYKEIANNWQFEKMGD